MEGSKCQFKSWRKTPIFCYQLGTIFRRQFHTQSSIRRLQNRILKKKASFVFRRKAHRNSKGPRKKKHYFGGSKVSPRKKCNRNCRPPKLKCGVLFNHIHCTKTIRGVSSNSELEKIKQIHKESAFQNGNI